MKKLLLGILLLFSVSAFAKEFTEVIEAPDKTADQLYSSARGWFAETFKSADDVLQMDDPVSGKLIGKGFSKVPIKAAGMIVEIKMQYTIKIFVKDGRFKYDISNIRVGELATSTLEEYELACSPEGAKKALIDAGMKNPGKKIIEKTANNNKMNYPKFEEAIKNIVADLKIAMKGAEDDW
ncbi:DUF4468 domain-containing protein [Labilibaculum sp. A4]|uniref:DUF4468 domain-containing protein n=1 Tax=Labilibaculum euxinus TaxID=2686357 RepID=UPI000F619570|nr:DUF4468 domain-containing protein [Labilibaculum euxinus]MDQ1770429.1 DUF4468 domain-containing protein [Labilibaculum euxinus]MWN75351.1 DUF4468 domain-containing protein [Labilibaculum euxinus]